MPFKETGAQHKTVHDMPISWNPSVFDIVSPWVRLATIKWWPDLVWTSMKVPRHIKGHFCLVFNFNTWLEHLRFCLPGTPSLCQKVIRSGGFSMKHVVFEYCMWRCTLWICIYIYNIYIYMCMCVVLYRSITMGICSRRRNKMSWWHTAYLAGIVVTMEHSDVFRLGGTDVDNQVDSKKPNESVITVSSPCHHRVVGIHCFQANMGEERQDPSGGLMYNQFLGSNPEVQESQGRTLKVKGICLDTEICFNLFAHIWFAALQILQVCQGLFTSRSSMCYVWVQLPPSVQ